jgi:hypothetical protein
MNRVLSAFVVALITAAAIKGAILPPARDHVKVMIHKRSIRNTDGAVTTNLINTSSFSHLSVTTEDMR